MMRSRCRRIFPLNLVVGAYLGPPEKVHLDVTLRNVVMIVDVEPAFLSVQDSDKALCEHAHDAVTDEGESLATEYVPEAVLVVHDR